MIYITERDLKALSINREMKNMSLKAGLLLISVGFVICIIIGSESIFAQLESTNINSTNATTPINITASSLAMSLAKSNNRIFWR